MELVTEYPLWFIVFCLAAGAVYALAFYFRDTLLNEISGMLRGIMAFLRGAAVALLAFFLLSPLLQTLFREVEKPIVVIAQDRSQSLVHGKDSSFFTNDFPGQLGTLTESLGEAYEVATFNFGETVAEDFDFEYPGKQTDLSQVFEEVYTRFSNRNLGAVIIASDGIYNKGTNPLYASGTLSAPLYTIALGDTTVKKDLILNRVAHNRLAYLGNDFPLEIVVEARQLEGATTRLTVTKGGAVVFQQQLNIESNSYLETIPVLLEAEEIGIQGYNVQLEVLDNEVTAANNSQRVYIDVLDARQKILLLAHTPHPDIAAIRHSIESNDNYEVTAKLASGFNEAFEAYNLVIMHQVPAKGTNYKSLLAKLKKAAVPVLHILGNTSNINAFNAGNFGLRITENRNNQNEVIPTFNSNFTLFSLSDRASNFLKRLPPVGAPFGNYRKGNSVETLLNQRIGLVETNIPLLMFVVGEEVKTGFFAAEGLWRWRMADYAEHGNHDIFNELIGKSIQYLSVKDDKSRFRITAAGSFLENETIIVDAELYNESYELITEPEVTLQIVNEEGVKFPFAFNRSTRQYTLNAGQLPVGQYRYTGQAKVGEKVLTASGAFTVNPVHVELVNTVANHQLLYNLSQRHEGAMVYPENMASLAGLLAARDDVKSVSYTKTSLRDLINVRWIFFLILGLLSLEWFLRKRNGAY